uniref:C2H2-type domain-containing protein n=1 Tax=Biomphalaria glabrata TaxID=6526 RepID=A0A2C9JCJ3_BIOGL
MELLVHTDSNENLLAKTMSVKTIKEELLENCECDSSSVSLNQHFLSASDGALTTDMKPILSEVLESETNESDDPKVKPNDPCPTSLKWFSGHDSIKQELKPNILEIDPLLSENVKRDISTAHSPSLNSLQSLEDVKPDISSNNVTFHARNTTACALNSVKQEILHTKETVLHELDAIQPFSSTVNSIKFEAKQEPVSDEESHCRDHLNTMETGFPESHEIPKRGRRRKVQEIFECEICSKIFSYRCRLLSHLNRHADVKRFKCERCNKCFSQNHTLKVHHCKTSTKQNDLKKKVKLVQPKVKKCNSDQVLHFCDVCGKSSPRKTDIVIHKRMHTGEKPYCCVFCDRRFARNSDLHVHLRRHLGEKQFSCELCGKQYHRKNHLNVHKLQNHSNERPLSCEFCGKTFVVRASLLVHRMTHTGEKLHKCSKCGKAFTHFTSLKKHLMGHTGEKPYQCEICFKGFKTKHDMISHKRKHTGEKPYNCDLCDKSFSFQTSYRRHKLIHIKKTNI